MSNKDGCRVATIHLSEERRLQLEEGRRLAAQESGNVIDRLRQDANGGKPQGKKAGVQRRPEPQPTGHQAFLEMLKGSGASIKCVRMDTDEVVVGTIKASDNFTISLQTDSGVRVLFKHALAEFSPMSPKPSEIRKLSAAAGAAQ